MKTSSLLSLIFIFSILVATKSYGKYVVIGHEESSHAQVVAEIIKQVFERKGFNVATKSGSTETMINMLVEREIDFFVPAWITTKDQHHWESNKSKLKKVGLIFEGAEYFFSVPSYISPEDLSSISDAKRSPGIDKLKKKIFVVESDDEMIKLSQKAITAYQLKEANFIINFIKDREYLETLNNAMESKEWFIFASRSPFFINRVLDSRKLDDPKSVFIKSSEAHLIANSESWDYIKKPMQDILKKIELSIKSIEELDEVMRLRMMPVHDVARRWLGSRPNTVEYWLQP